MQDQQWRPLTKAKPSVFNASRQLIQENDKYKLDCGLSLAQQSGMTDRKVPVCHEIVWGAVACSG